MMAIAVLSLFWGYSWVFMKIGLLDSGPFVFSGLRTLLGSLMLFAVIFATHRTIQLSRYKDVLLLSLFNTLGSVGLIQYALVDATATRTAMLMFTYPFWTLLLAWPILDERIKGIQWFAIILAFCGLILMLKPHDLNGITISNLAALAAAISWAIASIIVKRILENRPMDLLVLTGSQMAVGAIGLFAIAFFMNEQLPTITARFTFALCATGFLSTGLGWLLWVYLLDKLNAGMTSMLTLLVPVIALVTASWHLGETIKRDDSIGMVLILAGLILLTYLGFKSRKKISNM